MIDFKEIIALSIYKTDYIYPMLKDTVKCVIYDIIFSRTILVGKPSARISYNDFASLSGCSQTTVKHALKEMLIDGYIKIVGAHYSRTANEYALNIKIPENLIPVLPAQRYPYKTINIAITQKQPAKLVLNSEGQAVINAIKSSMSHHERKLYEQKAINELMIEGVELTEEAIDNKITDLIIRSFSGEKRQKYLVRAE